MITSNPVTLNSRCPGRLEVVDDAQHEALRIAAGSDRVAVDVERVVGPLIVLDIHVAGVQAGALRQVVAITDFEVLRPESAPWTSELMRDSLSDAPPLPSPALP